MLELNFSFLLWPQMEKLVLARPFQIDKFCGRGVPGRTAERDPAHPPFGVPAPQDLLQSQERGDGVSREHRPRDNSLHVAPGTHSATCNPHVILGRGGTYSGTG